LPGGVTDDIAFEEQLSLLRLGAGRKADRGSGQRNYRECGH